ncbi:MAG: endonuclease domain-containing protein [Bacteroidales bacterium]|nr:endonuclease domain-containing protein [Bacteroidales bacterium]
MIIILYVIHEIPGNKKFSPEIKKQSNSKRKGVMEIFEKKQLCGRRFLRQHPIFHDIIGNEIFFYIPDFYCSEEKLAVELDGGIHIRRKGKDRQRDEILESKGIRVIRIKNKELTDLPNILQKIQACFNDE